MDELSFTYVSAADIARLGMTDDEILQAMEDGLRAQGKGETVLEPRAHLVPDPAFNGHFNLLSGYVAPLGVAGVKVVGDFVDNYKRGLPSEMGLVALFDPRSGPPHDLTPQLTASRPSVPSRKFASEIGAVFVPHASTGGAMR